MQHKQYRSPQEKNYPLLETILREGKLLQTQRYMLPMTVEEVSV